MEKPLPLARIVPISKVLSENFQAQLKPDTQTKRWNQHSHLTIAYRRNSIPTTLVAVYFSQHSKKAVIAKTSVDFYNPVNPNLSNKISLSMKNFLILLVFFISTIYT